MTNIEALEAAYKEAEKANNTLEAASEKLQKELNKHCSSNLEVNYLQGDGFGAALAGSDLNAFVPDLIALIKSKGKISKEDVLRNTYL